MPRLRFYDWRTSRGPSSVGLLPGDYAGNANFVNSAQRRLLLAKEAGDEGWYGTWAEMIFQVSRSGPYITTPRGVARIEAMTICDQPVFVQNQFYEYLDFGNGTLPKQFRCQCNSILQTYQRNNAITFTDMTPGSQIVVYATNAADAGKRVFIQGISTATQEPLTSLDGYQQGQGEFLNLKEPPSFSFTPEALDKLTGLQKDQTVGPVQFFQMNPTTGAQTLIHVMEPSEQVAGYTRYYVDSLPSNCCTGGGPPSTLQVKAIVKLDLIPVQADTDYLLIQNLEAVIEEAGAVRYSSMDTQAAKQFEAVQHKKAIRLLQGELVHYLGQQRPAIYFAPFGSARLSRRKIGTLI